MEHILVIASGLIYGLSLLFSYRSGKRDADGEKTQHRVILPPKSKPITEEEKAAADRQRRIDAFKG